MRYLTASPADVRMDDDAREHHQWMQRVLLQAADATAANASNATGPEKSNFPTDLFTAEQRKQGAIVLHILGMCVLCALRVEQCARHALMLRALFVDI